MNSTRALTQIVVAMVQALAATGIETRPLLRELGLPENLSGHASNIDLEISNTQFATLFHRIKELTGDESFGFDTAEKVPGGNFEALTQHMLTAATLTEGLQQAQRLSILMRGDSSRFSIVWGKGVIRMGFHREQVDGDIPTQVLAINDAVHLYWWARFTNWLVGSALELNGVELADQNEANLELYKALFSCPIQLGGTENTFVIADKYGDYPIVRSGNDLANFAADGGGWLAGMSEQTKLSYSQRVKAVLMQSIGEEMPSLEQTAQQVKCSTATLRRNLALECSSFQLLKNECREETARELICRQDVTIADVAHQLGFSTSAAFNRAFKSWTGETPGEYRNRQD
ncbi:MAG: AraC family transcriptional regulator ligand-binding domain-containing protein [Halioglobus sp.]